MIVFSVLCWAASLLIPPTGEGAPNLTVRRNVVGLNCRAVGSCAKTRACGGARWSRAGSGWSGRSRSR